MIGYVARRVAVAFPTLLGAATVTFAMMRIVPGDPARVLAGPDATTQDIDNLRRQLGLDGPVWLQYVTYLGRLAVGNLGQSARTGRPVLDEVMSRLPNTLSLALLSIVVAVLLGCLLGMVAATRSNSPTDTILSGLSVFGVSMPVYWSGILLILLFSVHLGWLPAAGAGTWKSYVLPTTTLSFFAIGFISRQARSAMVETLGMDFVRSLRARGLGPRSITFRHVFRNAALPIVTIIGLQFGQMLGGAVITETIFAWPGLGRLLIDSIGARDFPTVQGIVFLFAAALIVVNLVTDLLYAYIDPRIRYD